MNNSIYITSVFSRMDAPEIQPEKLVDTHAETIRNGIIIPPALEVIEHASAETHSNGMVELIFISQDCNEVGYVSIPVKAGFLFTWTKGNGDFFKPAWSASLS